jgi:hypothetical protein
MTVAPITPTAMSIALLPASDGTTEWYKMADGSGFTMNISYRYPKPITETNSANSRSRSLNLCCVAKIKIKITSIAPNIAA